MAQAFGVSKRSAEGNASAQMEKHGIRARVAELPAQSAESFSLNRATWFESFARLAQKAEEAGNYAAARSNLREISLAMPEWYDRDDSKESGAPGRDRTCDQPIRNRLLYPLSYGCL
jgi:hypothetical protein